MAAAGSGSAPRSISVLLTCYKRPHVIADQLNAVLSQTVPVKEVWLVRNTHPAVLSMAVEALEGLTRTIVVSPNLGVWARFPLCMEFETDFVCVFDDDTIPGNRWLENCFAQFDKQPGLYGTIGIRYPAESRRPYQRFGWAQPNAGTTEVDIVGHSWFFRREWLNAYCSGQRPMRPDGTHYRTCGEDYWFSYTMQKRVGLKTYVPPHPLNDTSMWGSIRGELGRDKNALYKNTGEEQNKTEFHAALRERGWQLCCERS